MTLGIEVGTRNNMLAQITSRAGASAKLRIYSGTQPATGGTATTLLSENICNATFAPAPSAGVLTLNAIASGTAASTGTATWFRIVQSDGSTHVLDGTVGTSGADLNLNTTSIVSGATVSITSFTITAGNP
jgi:hypothetical protein